MRLSSFARPLLASVVLLVSASFIPGSVAAPAPRAWAPNPFAPLTPERIAALPAAERAAWQAYWDDSVRLLNRLPARPQPDRSSFERLSTPPKGGVHSKGLALAQPAKWYGCAEARTIADRIVQAQLTAGAWKKGVDYTWPVDIATLATAVPTFDNNATIAELRFLVRVLSAAGNDARAGTWRDALARGLRYVFAAQYPNGGFPQMYPLVGGYHDGITFNDDAMTQLLELLRDIGDGRDEFAAVPAALRTEAAARFARGLGCVLATQLRNSAGARTVWCQQYDPLTLRPAAARNFEPIADCSRESALIAELLMSLPQPSPEVVAAVEGAAAWFRATALRDLKIARAPADRRGEAIPAPGAPPLWARFYEPGTETPIFGDRDRTIHYDLAEVSAERIAGYAWYTDLPNQTLAKFERWQAARTAAR